MLATASLVVFAASLLWLGRRRIGIRPTHGELTGAMLGPLVAVGVGGWLSAAIGVPWGGPVAVTVGAVLLLAIASGAAGLTRKWAETRAPRPLLTWTGAASVLAGLGGAAHTGVSWISLLAVGLGIGLLPLGFGILVREGASFRPSRGRELATLLLAAVAVPFWPWILPWLFEADEIPAVGSWPPNMLVVAVEDPAGAGELPGWRSEALEVLAATGVSYPTLDPEPDVSSVLQLRNGTQLALRLHTAGYATAAILTEPDVAFAEKVGAEETDDRLGAWQGVEASAWMPGASLLAGFGSGSALRSAEEVADDAARWILNWRTLRAPAPFFLLVDFRGAVGSPESIDSALSALLDRVEELEIDTVTLRLVALEDRAPDGSVRNLGALLSPPPAWAWPLRLEVQRPTWGRELGESLVAIAESNGETPITLPGLPEAFAPPRRFEP